MRKFLIATHGNFSAGIKSSLEIIAGTTDNIFLIQAYTDGNKSIREELEKIMQDIQDDDELIVFTDLTGGSITNQVLQYCLKENVYIVSGVNLPLLLDIILADPDLPVNDVIETGIVNARDQIVFVNKLLNPKSE
ncbi:MAG: PTS fructose transporter subunit IIA [Bacteroidales bacterium]|nr:PTS fructose transporter subunit IIA [Bacteroidales bacterium]